MTTYIDDHYRLDRSRVGRMRMSHMIADTDAELHIMAGKIGVHVRHFQHGHGKPHYDVCMQMRERAINFGATPITLRQCARMSSIRKGLRLPHLPLDDWHVVGMLHGLVFLSSCTTDITSDGTMFKTYYNASEACESYSRQRG